VQRDAGAVHSAASGPRRREPRRTELRRDRREITGFPFDGQMRFEQRRAARPQRDQQQRTPDDARDDRPRLVEGAGRRRARDDRLDKRQIIRSSGSAVRGSTPASSSLGIPTNAAADALPCSNCSKSPRAMSGGRRLMTASAISTTECEAERNTLRRTAVSAVAAESRPRRRAIFGPGCASMTCRSFIVIHAFQPFRVCSH
jgi:hypothetical protein